MNPRIGPGATVTTTTGEVLRLGACLGTGGQGSVYAVDNDPAMVVKLYKGLALDRQVATRERLGRLARLMPSPELVLPQKVLEVPLVGYAMERVSSFAPLGDLCLPTEPDVRAWYAGTGGLRRRLLLGVQLAWAFQELHTRGLAYCDLSFDNLRVSTQGQPELRLIDCDNLSLEGLAPGGMEGTPWFVAPEVLAGRQGPDPVTDAWSLAVLLYHLLVLTHPLRGDVVRDAPPEVEDQALAGWMPDGSPLPWIDHPEDGRNQSRLGLPRALVLSPGLRTLFHQAFADGLRDRHQRPTEGRWADALGRAVDATVICPSCRNTHLELKARACPWCGASVPPAPRLDLFHADGRRPFVVERRRFLHARHLQSRGGVPREPALAEVARGQGEVVVRCLGDQPIERVDTDGRVLGRAGRGQQLSVPDGGWFQLAGQNPRARVVIR